MNSDDFKKFATYPDEADDVRRSGDGAVDGAAKAGAVRSSAIKNVGGVVGIIEEQKMQKLTLMLKLRTTGIDGWWSRCRGKKMMDDFDEER